MHFFFLHEKLEKFEIFFSFYPNFRSIREQENRTEKKKRKISVWADDLWRAIPKAGAARSPLASFAEKGNGVKIRGQKSAYDTEERLVSG